MLERSVACSDFSSLHSYFSTGIVRLMSPLHNRCHLPVRLRAVQNLRGFRRLRLQNGARYGRWQLILSSSVRHSVEGSSGACGANKRGLPNDVYFQVGLLTTIGLASKNAILIVEFFST